MKTIEQVTLLYEISNALNEHLDLKKSMFKALDIYQIHYRWNVVRSPF